MLTQEQPFVPYWTKKPKKALPKKIKMSNRKRKRVKLLLEAVETMIPEQLLSACCGDVENTDYYQREINKCMEEIWRMI
jgi:hypothetical protein